MKSVCIILARGGSQRLPGKNIRDFCGKPLIAHTIIAAKDSELFSDIFVSSDYDSILQVAKKYGAQIIKRPKKLATAKSSSLDALRHAIKKAKKITSTRYDAVCLLQPTSPLRTAEDIRAAFAQFGAEKAPSLVSVFKPHTSPYFNMSEITKDVPVYKLNGAIYIYKKEDLLERQTSVSGDSARYIMPAERSVDIDDLLDFELAEFLYRKQ